MVSLGNKKNYGGCSNRDFIWYHIYLMTQTQSFITLISQVHCKSLWKKKNKLKTFHHWKDDVIYLKLSPSHMMVLYFIKLKAFKNKIMRWNTFHICTSFLIKLILIGSSFSIIINVFKVKESPNLYYFLSWHFEESIWNGKTLGTIIFHRMDKRHRDIIIYLFI